MKFATSLFALAVAGLLAFAALTPPARPARTTGWNFDTGLNAEQASDLLCREDLPPPPAGSWLRVRDLARSRVPDGRGGEIDRGPGGASGPSVAVRRASLAALRARGYRLVALLDGGPPTWTGGVRGPSRERRLPLDLRDAFDLGRQLAATYGDLVDWWEIQNEPDIGFVAENPETYAAFLKACYLGIQRGRADLRPAGRSRVLMGPLALPPGPYFEAWARNGGLDYTDGFNYHYYGYAEDFSGVYRQFQAAVAQWGGMSAAMHAGSDGRDRSTEVASVFSTQFYPSADGWQEQVVAMFDFPPGAAAGNTQRVRVRPLAAEEPPLSRQGRWWVTSGVTVEETAGGWRFTVDRRPPGPLRAPVAELPLPVGWTAPGDAFIGYGYRLVRSPDAALQATLPRPRNQEESSAHRLTRAWDDARSRLGPPAAADLRPTASVRWPTRELPVFLTEYGYGSLDRASRLTAEGRERQRRWFASVGPQIRALGIEGAMAFVLKPYLEIDLQEFGLLMNADSGPAARAGVATGSIEPGARWGAQAVSPALAELLRQGRKTLRPQPWVVATPPPQAVVIDFVAGQGLGQAKTYGGYFLQGTHGRTEPGQGSLVVYNFGETAVAGRLELEGPAWRLPGGGKSLPLRLSPGERRLVAVQVATGLSRFVASPVTARFRSGGVGAPGELPPPKDAGPVAAAVPAPPEPPPATDAATGETFEVYFRTEQGNLYEARARVLATPTWRYALDRIDNFTPAFYGRQQLPWRLSENEPASLVFYFHPRKFPAVYEITSPVIKRFAAPPAAK